MPAASNYLQTCIETVQKIDPEELDGLMPGHNVGVGTRFFFRPVGRLGSINQFAGLKLPKSKELNDAETRLATEIAQIALHLEAAPELTASVPGFMGILAVSTTESGAIIVEDASQNGQSRVTERPASTSVRESLYKAYKDTGSFDQVMHTQRLDQTIAFNAGEREVLLDFSPPPVKIPLFGLNGHGLFQEYFAKTLESLEGLTIEVPLMSSLGQVTSKTA